MKGEVCFTFLLLFLKGLEVHVKGKDRVMGERRRPMGEFKSIWHFRG